MSKILAFTILIGFNIFSTCNKKVDLDSICFEFDQRQCKGDVWADLVPMNISKTERETKMKNYLESEGILVQKLVLVENFHEGVCEACFVCPEEDRFFVKMNIESETKFADFEFLNSNKVDCSDHF